MLNTIKLAESQSLLADVVYFGMTEVLKHSGLENLLSPTTKEFLAECVLGDTYLVPPLCLLQ